MNLLRLAAAARLAVAAALVFTLATSNEAFAADVSSRLIVKFRTDGAKAHLAPAARVQAMAADTQVPMHYVRPMTLGMSLVAIEDGGPTAEAAIARLASLPDVEWVEADRKAHARRTPNDEFLSGQTYLFSDANAIDAVRAWDITTGSASTVVAVIDTGYRPHADLAGRILPGYDFVSDPAVANDGDGRDPDATDPGDWVSAADISSGAFSCPRDNSSWHGTGVAGIIAANTDNGQWVAGIDWQAKVLPVRVLGKCGGTFSDILDGVAWAAGIAVPGVPANPYPAQVINMSLGGTGPCSQGAATVFAAALAAGHTKAIVAAAGNDGGDAANHTPSNCPGVISVASTTTIGNIATYSNRGPAIDLSAPGGQYRPASGLDGIIVLSDRGLTTPAGDAYNNVGGTSFAAPMVSGTVALMLAVNPRMTTTQIVSTLLSTAHAFPAGSNCNTSLCGAGILNTRDAVAAAQALAPATPTIVTVVEYYNQSLDHYFITWMPAEIAALDAGTTLRGWQRTGYTFKVYASAQAGTSPVCRYYMPPAYGDSHFFGRGITECQQTGLAHPGFVLESSEFMDVVLPVQGTCAAGLAPVYRVFSNRLDANHRYMTDRAVRDLMVSRGWLAEGDGPDLVVMCVPQ